MAEKYEEYEEEYAEEQGNSGNDGLEDIYGTSSAGGPSYVVIGLIVALIGAVVFEYFKINELKTELSRATSDRFGTEQTVSDQKSKLNTRDQTISQLEGRITTLEKQVTEYKSRAASAEGRVNDNSGEVSDLKNKLSAAQADADKYKAAVDAGGEFNNLFKVEDLKVLTFRGGKGYSAGQGKLIWSQKLGAIYLNIFNLAKNPDDKEYQLWANEGDKFFKVGLFSVGDDKTGFIKLTAPGDLAGKKVSDFVVTLEKKGGSEKITRPYHLTGSLFQ